VATPRLISLIPASTSILISCASISSDDFGTKPSPENSKSCQKINKNEHLLSIVRIAIISFIGDTIELVILSISVRKKIIIFEGVGLTSAF
jgi:hypothetical protein